MRLLPLLEPQRPRLLGRRLHAIVHPLWLGCVAADFNEGRWIDLAVANHKVWGDHRGLVGRVVEWAAGFDPHRITRLPSKGPHGMTLSPGNQRDGGPEEFYESRPFEFARGRPGAAHPLDGRRAGEDLG